MESLVDTFSGFYKGKRIIITGHTGFKGSWLSIWLNELGAEVVGLGLDPFSERDNYILARVGEKIMGDFRGDIRNRRIVEEVFSQIQPEIVFHLAAQPLVRHSYEFPVETYETNIMGTIHVLEAIRSSKSIKVAIMITTDKCYENREQIWGYREDEPMGGYDPYSSSKAAAEIAIASWRRSFFNPSEYDKHGISIASVRAGNVIGGGDWAKDRIIPDCIRALEQGRIIDIRNPKSIRPWQHVLEPLGGYLLLAKKMWYSPIDYCEGWNFGPYMSSVATVWEIAERIATLYAPHDGEAAIRKKAGDDELHEADLLLLDINKAKFRLGWTPRMGLEKTVKMTVDWYKKYRTASVYNLCVKQIIDYVALDRNE